MAIGTITSLSVVKVPLTLNSFILNVAASVTGDGTGGNISCSPDLASYIPTGSKVTILDANQMNNDAAARKQQLSITTSQWENGMMGVIIGYHSASQVEYIAGGASRFYSGMDSKPQRFPMYLGKLLTANAVLVCECDTNTNTKTYQWYSMLLVTAPTT